MRKILANMFLNYVLEYINYAPKVIEDLTLLRMYFNIIKFRCIVSMLSGLQNS
ncbi:hypothetical protein ACE1ET_09480 [Saccharicrinis sp. FJH62]